MFTSYTFHRKSYSKSFFTLQTSVKKMAYYHPKPILPSIIYHSILKDS